MNNLADLFSTSAQTTWYILLAISFTGGFVASISPCSIAMLPLIVGYVGGYSKETPFKTFLQLLFFIFGTSIIFTTIGIICAITGSVFASYFGGYFTLIIASVLLIMGLKLLDLLYFDTPYIIKTMPVNKTNSIFVYPVLLGIVFALAGTPCSTPILAGIMAFSAIGQNVWLGVLMLAAFSVGSGIILILAGLFTSLLKNLKSFAKYTDWLVKFCGVLLVGVAVFLYWKIFSPLF